MKKLLCSLSILLLCFSAGAVDKITATLTFTNATVAGNTLTVNGNVRTWTNQVFTPGTQILTNTDITGSGPKTNAFNQIALTPFANVTPLDTGSNTFQLSAPCGSALVVTLVGTYGKVTYSTQVCATATPVGVPFSSYYSPVQTRSNTASQLEADLLAYTTNSSIVDLAKTQTITGEKTLSNTNNHLFGTLTSLAISGNSVRLTNGVYFTPALSDPAMTNGVNYGAAFESPGPGDGSQQFGHNATASGENSHAFGNNAIASGLGSLAVGASATASGEGAVAFGSGATATNTSTVAVGANSFAAFASGVALGDSSIARAASATAVGEFSDVEAPNGTAIGANSLVSSTHTNSTAVGKSAATTAANQVMLGSPGISTVVQNDLTVQTNETIGGSLLVTGGVRISGLQTNAAFIGTNNFPAGADVAFGRNAISSLANANNAAVPVGTNVFIEVSGPTGAFTINGIANGRDGKLIVIVNQTGFDMTIAHQSGTDPTAGNRIISMTGADRATTGNGCATLIYSGAASRWLLISFDP